MAETADIPGHPGVVIVSPHLDDAVLSAWSVLSGATPVLVVTVFAGIPESGFVTDLDRRLGATDSAEKVRIRRRNDAAILTSAGARHAHLDLLDVQFTAYERADVRARIAERPSDFVELVAGEPGASPESILAGLRPHVGPEAVVYGPAGIGGHPDHRAVSRVMLALAGEVRELRLYADSPYFVRHGLPSWIGGADNPEADRLVARTLAELGVAGARRTVTELTPPELAAKMRALRRYTTEFPTLEAHFTREPATPAMAGYEVSWNVSRE
ncbi:PIG-L family deacetylase [Streptosporangium sp. LJ11]|uniref:PIG-L deacetylase family protein n=1 Tax=Streptosporangium sp. LJ11 TaxID=3436927 RepID=UPI003F7A8725